MIGFSRRKVLAELLARGADAGATEMPGEDDLERQILEVLSRLGGNAAMKDLARETGVRPGQLRERLRGLVAAGRLQRRGERFHARYYLT